jgi:hypothetical protein
MNKIKIKENIKSNQLKKKAISPIISVILLVAIVMILMGIYLSWSQTRSLGLIDETKEETKGQVGAIACMDADFVISNISINSITKEITFKVENKSRIDLINPKITIMGKINGETVSYYGQFKETIKGGYIAFLSTFSDDFSFQEGITYQDLPLEIDLITIVAQNCPLEIMEFRRTDVDYKDLVGWWKFDEGEGTTVVDSSGNGNNGTIVGGVSWVDGLGNGNKTLSFDGLTGQVELPHQGSDQITFSLWVLNDYDNGSERNPRRATKKGGGASIGEFITRYGSMGVSVYLGGGSPTPSYHDTTGISIPMLNFYHVAWTYDKTQLKMYVNGEHNRTVDVSREDGFSDDIIYLGDFYGLIDDKHLGFFDDFRLYNAVLSQDEILEIYNTTKDYYKDFVIDIDSPIEDSNYFIYMPINFKAKIYNPPESYTCNWTSSIDGLFIEDDCDVNVSSLSLGEHTITLEVVTSEETKTIYKNITIEREIPQENLVLHLDASSIEGLSDGDRIETWLDQSLNFYNFTEPNVNKQPFYKENGINGLSVVEFKEEEWLRNSEISSESPSTIFVVWRINSESSQVWPYVFDSYDESPRTYLAHNSSRIYTAFSDQIFYDKPKPFDFIINSVVTGTNGKIFENGILMASGDVGAASISGLVLGGRYNEPRLYGDIAEIIIYDKELLEEERQQVEEHLMEKYGLFVADINLEEGLVSYWNFDDIEGDVIDSHGDNNGTNIGATRGVNGVINNAFEFDGIGNYIEYSSTDSLRLVNDFTIQFWIYPHNLSSEMFFYSAGYNNNNSNMIYYNSGEIFIAEHKTSNQGVSSGVSLSENQWQFVTIVRLNNVYYFYINGNFEKSANSNGVNTDAHNHHIGFAYPRNKANTWFDGKIDEVGIWNRALSSLEVEKLYNNGIGLTYPFS